MRIAVRTIGNNHIPTVFDLHKGTLKGSQFDGVEQITGKIDGEDVRDDFIQLRFRVVVVNGLNQ